MYSIHVDIYLSIYLFSPLKCNLLLCSQFVYTRIIPGRCQRAMMATAVPSRGHCSGGVRRSAAAPSGRRSIQLAPITQRWVVRRPPRAAKCRRKLSELAHRPAHAQRRRGVHAVMVNDHRLGGGLAPKLGGRHKAEPLVGKCRRQRPIRRRDPTRPPATTATARRGALPGGRHCVVLFLVFVW